MCMRRLKRSARGMAAVWHCLCRREHPQRLLQKEAVKEKEAVAAKEEARVEDDSSPLFLPEGEDEDMEDANPLAHRRRKPRTAVPRWRGCERRRLGRRVRRMRERRRKARYGASRRSSIVLRSWRLLMNRLECIRAPKRCKRERSRRRGRR